MRRQTGRASRRRSGARSRGPSTVASISQREREQIFFEIREAIYALTPYVDELRWTLDPQHAHTGAALDELRSASRRVH